MWCLCGQYFALGYGWYFFVTWFPTYLLKERGLDVKQSALLAGTPLLLGGFGAFVAGWITPHLARWSGGVGSARKILGAGGMIAGGALLFVSTFLANPYLAVAAIALVSFCNDLSLPGSWTACMDVGGRYVGTLGGAMNMLGNAGGFFSPIILGMIVQRTNSWTIAFYVTSVVSLGGAICWLLLDPTTPLEEQVKD